MKNEIISLNRAPPSQMETVHRHRLVLGTTYPIDAYTALPPLADLAAARRELAEAMVPAPLKDVQRLVAVLVASYPQRGPAVPDVYIGAMAAELDAYPPDVLREMVSKVRRSVKFLPSIAEVIEIADELMAERRRMQRNLERLEREHARRVAQQAEADARKREQDEHDAEIGRKLAAIPGAPRLGEFLLAEMAMRHHRSGTPTDRWTSAAEWKAALLRGEGWAITACRLGALAQVACTSAIGREARLAILKMGMGDLDRARAMLKAANGEVSEESFDRIKIGSDVTALVTELLSRERIDGGQAAGQQAA